MAKPVDPLKSCLHLRSKQMYYETATTRSPEHDAEVERLFGACDTAMFWCQCTQTGRGPDDAIVGREECANSTRRCFHGVQSLG
jgi:hypothetical protein